MSKTKFSSNLQILRGLAAMNVVIFHCIGSARDYGMPPSGLSFLAGWGMSGVDLFFVLSGFIMVHTQMYRPISPSDFIINRIIRIVPLYWVLTALILAVLLGMPSAFREATFEMDRALASFLFLSMAMQGTHPYLGVGWTLEFEMLFYVIFAISLFLNSREYSLFFLASVLIALVVFAGTNSIVFEFLLGVGAALLFQKKKIPSWAGWLALSSGALLWISTIWIPPVGPRWVYWGVPAVLLVLGAMVLPNMGWRLAERLGDASYSIYLIQVFSIPFFFKLLQFTGNSSINGDLAVLAATVLTACAGLVTYYVLECPLIAVCKRIDGGHRSTRLSRR